MKVRSSIFGNLLAEPKSKAAKERGELSETSKKIVSQVYIKEKYGRIKDIKNKYCEKGTLQEDEAIEMLSRVDNTVYFKNQKYFENDFITGTPDLIMRGVNKVLDIKCTWDIFTFHESEPSRLYIYQLKCYMWLLGFKQAELVFCLVDTPDHLIQKEIGYIGYNAEFNSIEAIEEKERQIYVNMAFADIPEKDRIKRFPVILEDADIEVIKTKVIAAREHYKTLKL